MAVVAAKAGDEFIVVARDVDDARALARFAEKFLDDVVVLLRPINSAPHLPDIDKIPDDVERLELMVAEKLEEHAGVAAPGAEMHIRDPRRAKSPRCRRSDDAHISDAGWWIERLHFAAKIAGANASRQSEFCYVCVAKQSGEEMFLRCAHRPENVPRNATAADASLGIPASSRRHCGLGMRRISDRAGVECLAAVARAGAPERESGSA